jgi:hypothetical protein
MEIVIQPLLTGLNDNTLNELANDIVNLNISE